LQYHLSLYKTSIIKQITTTKIAEQAVTPLIANNNNIIDSTKYSSLTYYNTQYAIINKKPTIYVVDDKLNVKQKKNVLTDGQIDPDALNADRVRNQKARKKK